MNSWVAVFVGGGAGSVLRFAISNLLMRSGLRSGFPWATLASNLLATAILAWLVMRFGVNEPGRETWRALLVIGLCGGFSTLSTFSWENFQLIREGLPLHAAANIVVSVGAGILFFHLFARSS